MRKVLVHSINVSQTDVKHEGYKPVSIRRYVIKLQSAEILNL